MSYEIKNKQKMPWSLQNDKRKKWLFNKLTTLMPGFNYEEDSYILQMNKPKLLKFILNLEIGDGSKEAFLFTVSKYLSIHDKKNIHIDKFVREGKKLMLKTKEADGDNLVDIHHADSYQSYDYFLKIITTKDYKNIIM